MRNLLHCPGNHTSFVKTITRISDLLSLLSQKLNLENNRASHKDGIGGREAFCILPWFCPFFTLSPLCLREEGIDSRSDRGQVSQSSSLFFCREGQPCSKSNAPGVLSSSLCCLGSLRELLVAFTLMTVFLPLPPPPSLLSFFFQHDQ